MLWLCINIYIVDYAVMSHKICLKKDILYTCTTQIQRKNKNDQLSKRSTNQINERSTRPHSPTTLRLSSHARLPNNNKNTQKLWCILRTKHSLPSFEFSGEKRPSREQMEHEEPKTTKSLWTDKPGKKRFRLDRKLTQSNLPENRKWHNNSIWDLNNRVKRQNY